MSANATLHSADPATASFEKALVAHLARFDLENGAVLIQIPQVPPLAMEMRIARNRGYFAYPPQSLFYLGAVFDGLGIPNRLVDLNYQTLAAADRGAPPDEAWRQAVDEAMGALPRPLACVSFMFDPTWPQLVAVVEHIRQNWPQSCIAVGGVAASADPERILRQTAADLVFSNEGEGPVQDFYAFLRQQAPWDLRNLSFVDQSGDLHQAPMRSGGAVDLDIRDQFAKLPIAEYRNVGSLNNFSRMRGTEVPFATVLSRRGCRAKCTFCAVRNFNGKSVRVRSTQGVIDEFVHLHDVHGIRHFDWLDDDLLYDHDAALGMFNALADRLPDITWAANNGLIAAVVSPELMAAMERSGCIGFGVGLETGNRELLRQVRKPATLEKFFAFAELSRHFPAMHYLVNFILGLPGETFAQMLDSFHVATRAALDWNNFFTFQPLKNTDAWLAYGGMDDGRADEDVVKRGTTMNFNPVRGGSLRTIEQGLDLATGYDVFDLDVGRVPNPAQTKEIWFTFNYIANFLRMPALTASDERKLHNARRWLTALGTAYEDNPSIDCLLAYLMVRQGESAASVGAVRDKAKAKFEESEYWRWRDDQFAFSALLDGQLPPLEARAISVFGRPA